MRAERVLVVTDEMEVGGSQRQIVHLLGGLVERGRQAELLYFRERSHLVDQLESRGVPTHRIDKRGALDLGFLLSLLRFLRRGRFDVVHAFSITAELWVRLLLPMVPGLRLVSSIRGLGLVGPGWHWRAKRWIVRGSAAVISNSRAGARLVAERCGLPPGRIDVVPNGLALPPPPDEATRAEARRMLGVPADAMLLLFVGRLVGEKDLGTLLEALALLPPGNRPLTWLAGEGPERGRVESALDRLGLGAEVRLLGECSDTLALMQAADLLVLPSREEGLSNVLLEAMGAGLPVVASAVGGTPELVADGENGRLVPPGEPAVLAGALRDLLDDPAMRHRLGAAARRHAERHYALDAMVDRTAGIYDRCLRVAGGAA